MSVRVLKTISFPNKAAGEQHLRRMGAAFRKNEDGSNLPLYRASTGIVFRVKWGEPTTMDVLGNCAC